ncbi:MAG: type II secretion system protein [Phycisphaerales bacterium JB064]
MAAQTRATRMRASARAGFTIIELGVSILVIAVLIGLLLVGLNKLSRTAQGGAERANVIAMRIAVESFKNDFGFAPPLVKDGLVYRGGGTAASPLGTVLGRDAALVYRTDDPTGMDQLFLQGESGNPDLRFSLYSLPYYLIGVLDADYDGKDGPGYREPARNGTFRQAGGRLTDPKFDVSENSDRLVEIDAMEGRFELRDRNGVAYRYYRWLPDDSAAGKTVSDLRNVPALLGDPADDITLRDAEYAIVAAGPNRVFGDLATEEDEAIRQEVGQSGDIADRVKDARADNVVEVGR